MDDIIDIIEEFILGEDLDRQEEIRFLERLAKGSYIMLKSKHGLRNNQGNLFHKICHAVLTAGFLIYLLSSLL